MKALLAPDKFKGTMSAGVVAEAMAAGLPGAWRADRCPVADGGEGTAAALLAARGGEWVSTPADDALGRPVEARFALLAGGETAVVEVAEASGLWRLEPDELRPLEASSAGTGELIAAAIEAGAGRVLVACGGSATTDAGRGALDRFDPEAIELVCLCDVSDPFMGALRYAPQKGAGEAELAELERRLSQIAAELPRDPARLPFTGAAGGLAGGLWAHGARLRSGSDHVLAEVGFDRRLAAAELVITGEGRLDPTSKAGKATGEVARRARRAGVAVHAVVGEDALGADAAALFDSVRVAGTAEAIAGAAREIAAAVPA
jgi:glycerate 2-kinase